MRQTGIVLNHTGDIDAHLDLCDSIRATLPQLQHLRLRLPLVCGTIFSIESPDQDNRYQAIRAPMLKTCLVNLFMCGPAVAYAGLSMTCENDATQTPYIGLEDQLPLALPPLHLVMRDFARLNSINLERLWTIEMQPPESWSLQSLAGWVRRDFISNASFPIPVTNLSGFPYDTWLVRVPPPPGHGETQDWVSSRDRVETVAEGNTWIETTSGVRLPMAMLQEHRHTSVTALTKAQFQEHNRISCILWIDEEITGQKLLPEGPGELMQWWDLNETTPSGWARDDYSGLLYRAP
ncbi:hypothetical protein F4677DRAFT_441554 [Hypoxylon crocopeplum]|nr:hypothetical protein F4677DRAFT_441554 [Hypoxylon crocopeplum]